jgi:hypothetical protein
LPAAAVQAVFDLEPLLDAATDEHLTDDDPRLDAVRQQAERCLAALGINLVEWEKMHGLTHAD